MNGESVWWSLSLSERLYLERAVSAIVRHYDANPITLRYFIKYAQHYTDKPIVRAVLWRLEEEIS